MAYTPLPAKADGDYFTLGNYNTVKGNFDAGAPAVYAAKGDLYGGTSTQAGARLAVGGDDSTLVADSSQTTGLAWQTQPAARVYSDADLPLTLSSWTTLEFSQERFDPDGCHSTVTNTTRLTVPAGGAGMYLIGGNVEMTYVGASYTFALRIMLNGSTPIAQCQQHVDGAHIQQVVTLYGLAVGDYVELQAYIDAPDSATIKTAGNYSPEFWLVWQRRA